MRLNDDGKTVAAMDVLAPGIGEIIGGSQREERLDVLDARMAEVGIDKESLRLVPRPAPLRHRAARRASAWASSAPCPTPPAWRTCATRFPFPRTPGTRSTDAASAWRTRGGCGGADRVQRRDGARDRGQAAPARSDRRRRALAARATRLPGFYVLAESDGRVVGSLMVTKEWSDWRNGDFWWIQSVYVRPECRRQGVYKRLYRHVQELAAQDRRSAASGSTSSARTRRAQATYRALGMKETRYLVSRNSSPACASTGRRRACRCAPRAGFSFDQSGWT